MTKLRKTILVDYDYLLNNNVNRKNYVASHKRGAYPRVRRTASGGKRGFLYLLIEKI